MTDEGIAMPFDRAESEAGVPGIALMLETPRPGPVSEFYFSILRRPVLQQEDVPEGAAPFAVREAASAESTRWIVRFLVPDLAALVARVESLGGTVDAATATATSAHVVAPDGSEFIAEESSSMAGFDEMIELSTQGLEASSGYYRDLFGLRLEEIPDDLHSYRVLYDGGRGIGGVLDMSTFGYAPVPSYWVPYFHVDDVDAVVMLAVDFGARVRIPPKQSSATARHAVLTDPSGAVFGVRERPSDGTFITVQDS